MNGESSFLSRWSRRKADVRRGVDVGAEAPADADTPADADRAAVSRARTVASPVTTPEPATSAVVPSSVAPPAVDAEQRVVPTPAAEPSPALPTLDDVARLTRESDYAPFVQPGVDARVKNAALKKLFSDPHFNVMDGLDTYIDDYGKPDPIPPAMLRRLNQALSLGLFDEPPGDAARTRNVDESQAAVVDRVDPSPALAHEDSRRDEPEAARDETVGKSACAEDPAGDPPA